MSTPEDKMNLYSQYRQAYGDLAEAGKFKVGERVLFGSSQGEVLWKYIDDGTLIYVIDYNSGFPVEVSAQEVREP